MSAEFEVPCLLCSENHGYNVIPGEPCVMYYRDGSGHPGSAPEVDWLSAGCKCSEHPVVNEGKYWDLMYERAMDEARRAV
jgi:hypothetical protein